MTSAEIRQSFLDFFKSKGHTIVPSASLLPDSPNLLFTNAGMNQFVPIFLGQRAPDVSKWPGAIPGSDQRAADTQKCIRAGGKHNDLEDVGLDTYHLTFFEMLGNWSFGDYFKKESLTWGWELLTKIWGIPVKRLFATVYAPDKSNGDPAEFDQEAAEVWTDIFRKEGLDPSIHIVHGGKKDNFWMMGDTGPCGPCSEIHFNLLQSDDEHAARALVNAGAERCIEIWNHVFIQFNANPDGTYSPLPAKHVDTGMGFDRIAGFDAGTKGFKEFSKLPSAYDTDIFAAIFAELEKLSGKKYLGTLPEPGRTGDTDQEKIDIAFRVIADHIRTLGFAIADGIRPGNKERHAVLRRILRRAEMFGRYLGFHEPFFYKLVTVLSEKMGEHFPEIRTKRNQIEEVIRWEEEAFNKTLDSGMQVFDEAVRFCQRIQDLVIVVRQGLETILSEGLEKAPRDEISSNWQQVWQLREDAQKFGSDIHAMFVSRANDASNRLRSFATTPVPQSLPNLVPWHELLQDLNASVKYLEESAGVFPGRAAFVLAATYGLPVEETERLARARGLRLHSDDYKKELEKHQALSRAAHRKDVVELSKAETTPPTQFVGYDKLESAAKVVEIVGFKDEIAVILDTSPFYAEMGGQVGDTGELEHGSQLWRITNTQKAGSAWLHYLDAGGQESRITNHESRAPSRSAVDLDVPDIGTQVTLTVDRPRRYAIQRHHTVTHLLHWALHEVVSRDAVQKGSYVGPDKLTFDFSSVSLTPQQVADVEKLVNERILENAPVIWTEIPYSEAKPRKDIMQFFGEKYGDRVRVVQIGGKHGALDGYSMELCGGTHTRATGELGLFRILAESAIAAGIRRIEAVSGLEAYKRANDELQLIKTLSGKVNSPVSELENKIESLLAQQKELEKQLKAVQQKQAGEAACRLAGKAQSVGPIKAIVENLGPADGDFLQAVADALKGHFQGVVILGGVANGAVSLVATVSPELTKQLQAGKIIQQIAPLVGGKGGGRPENARGGGKDVRKLEEALAQARKLIS